MVVIVLYAFMVLAVFFAAVACWTAISLQGKLNRIIEAQLRIESALRLEAQKSL
jgi:archaellin